MASLAILTTGVLVALLFCSLRTVLDLRARRVGWGVAGLAVGALLWWGALTPVPTHAVKVDLLRSS